MAEQKVKLTVRLPAELHQALRERAAEYNISLNQAMVDTLSAELIEETGAESEREQVRRILRAKGKLADTSWRSAVSSGSEPASLAEAREWLRDIPLTDWIIEDRGPR